MPSSKLDSNSLGSENSWIPMLLRSFDFKCKPDKVCCGNALIKAAVLECFRKVRLCMMVLISK